MSRISKSLTVVLIVGGMTVAYLVDAQQPAPRAPQAPRGIAAQEAQPAFPNIPSYYLLGMEQVQQELNLSQPQKDRIEQLSQAYNQQSQQELQALRELPPAEQQQKLAEAQQRAMTRIETLRQKLEGVLTEQQLDKLNQISFRMAIPTALNNPQVVERLQVSPKQQEQLQQVRQKAQEKLWTLEQEMAKESLEVLTPEQQKILRQMRDQRQ